VEEGSQDISTQDKKEHSFKAKARTGSQWNSERGNSERGSSDRAQKNGAQAENSGGRGGNSRWDGQRSGERSEHQKTGALEVTVDHNVEKAIKILKRKLIKEGLFKELKMRRYYEKPSEKKKRKQKESLKKIRKDEARSKKNLLLS
jgi:small subunit ribosomal protein S21